MKDNAEVITGTEEYHGHAFGGRDSVTAPLAARPVLGSVLDPDFAGGGGFAFPDGCGAFEFSDGPLAGFEGFSPVLTNRDDQNNIFTDVYGADPVNDAHVDDSVILDGLRPNFFQLFFRHLRVMLEV